MKMEMMTRCCGMYTKCQKMCMETVRFCLTRGGKLCEVSFVMNMIECAQLCGTCAGFCATGSGRCATTCEACARVCEECARKCGRFSEPEMVRCMKMLRECAQMCRKMMKSSPAAMPA